MKHVIALDISKGKSTIAIYNGYRQFEFEGEICHTRADFEELHKKIEGIQSTGRTSPGNRI